MYGRMIIVDDAATALALSVDQLSEMFDDAVDVDKSWEAAWPLVGAIAESGMILTDDVIPLGDDLGYGPAMVISAATVQEMASKLTSASPADVEAAWGALDNPLMTDRYDDPDGKEFAMDGYAQTVEVFRGAAESSKVIVFAIV